MSKPKGIRLLFWKVWGFFFNWRLWAQFKKLERKGYYTQRTVARITTKMLNEEAQKLYDAGAIADCRVYWKGAWVACEVKKK